MAVCIACGTENRDNAMFCRGCATSMVALAGSAAAASPKAPEPVFQGPTQGCPACNAKNPLVATSCKNCGASLVPDMVNKAKPPPDLQSVAASGSKKGLALVAGLALVVLATGAWWWGGGGSGHPPPPVATAPAMEQPQALGVNLNTTGMAAPAPVAEGAAPQPSAPAVDDIASTVAASDQADRIKKQASAVVEADRKRRAAERREREAREKAAADRQRLAQEQAQRQAELDRQRAEEAARQQALAAARSAAPAAAPARSVDTLCADSGNFIAREVCRTRECRSPAFTNDPVCVRFREVEAANRRAPTD